MLRLIVKGACVAGSILALSAGANAATFTYTTTFTELNDSGGSGNATVVYDDVANTLRVQIQASGLDDGLHVMHIHGRFSDGVDGDPIDSVTPVPESEFDTNNDGILTVPEGAPAYGPIILPLADSGSANSNNFQSGTSIDYDRTFDFSAPNAQTLFANVGDSNDSYGVEDLLPLFLREIVIHGVNEDGEFIASLPALAGELSEVPVPGAVILFGSALAAFGAARRRKAA
ncbi:CHRD domain-containing protein [Parvularcula maris]|uniref:CHRD domain-containing protein n=1 Tax=Parvularcula maris TaxID=2965077 RepID=A0A9X2L955_9PROT|nr:CHRD domain-containing protein [Parvularcula maris]MCQ8185322.1 CHRD domain-containing protein [Parvularcula maris]